MTVRCKPQSRQTEYRNLDPSPWSRLERLARRTEPQSGQRGRVNWMQGRGARLSDVRFHWWGGGGFIPLSGSMVGFMSWLAAISLRTASSEG